MEIEFSDTLVKGDSPATLLGWTEGRLKIVCQRMVLVDEEDYLILELAVGLFGWLTLGCPLPLWHYSQDLEDEPVLQIERKTMGLCRLHSALTGASVDCSFEIVRAGAESYVHSVRDLMKTRVAPEPIQALFTPPEDNEYNRRKLMGPRFPDCLYE